MVNYETKVLVKCMVNGYGNGIEYVVSLTRSKRELAHISVKRANMQILAFDAIMHFR